MPNFGFQQVKYMHSKKQLLKCYEELEGIINFSNPDSSELKLVLEFTGVSKSIYQWRIF